MSALYRLKAYFGMVPADELDDYAQHDYAQNDYAQHYADQEPPRGFAAYEPEYERGYRGRGSSRWSDDDDDIDDYQLREQDREPARPRQPRRGWPAETPVRGALAVDPNREVSVPRHGSRHAPAEEAHPLARITTLHPRTYNEARTIGEHYREGIPVIMNLTGMDDADAKRLVDFAAGLAFALRGAIDKITTKVFLISPPNVDVTAEDRRRIAEGRFLDQSS